MAQQPFFTGEGGESEALAKQSEESEAFALPVEPFDVEVLLQEPAQHVALRLLQQVKELEKLDAEMDMTLTDPTPRNLPIFKFTENVASVPADKQQVLVAHLARGFAEMEVGQRAEVTRLVLRVLTALTALEETADPRKIQEDTESALAALKDPSTLSVDEMKMHQQTLEKMKALAQRAKNVGPFLRHLLELLSRIGISPQQPELGREFCVTAGRTFVELGFFRIVLLVLELVTALDNEERQQVIKMAAGHVENRRRSYVLEQALCPGGFADQVVELLHFVSRWGKYWCILPIFELFLSYVLHPETALTDWIFIDSLLWMVAIIGGFAFWKAMDCVLIHAFEKLTQDNEKCAPNDGTYAETLMQRWLIASAIALFILVFSLLIGFISALVAVVLLAIWFFSYSSIATYVCCLTFAALRLVTTCRMSVQIWRLTELWFVGDRKQENATVVDYGTMPL